MSIKVIVSETPSEAALVFSRRVGISRTVAAAILKNVGYDLAKADVALAKMRG